MLSLILTVVITNPYQGINYNSINSYDIDKEYLEDVIHVTEAESSNYKDNESYSEGNENQGEADCCEIKEKEKNYQQELNRLYPYIFPSYVK
jgi:hypothetical protein